MELRALTKHGVFNAHAGSGELVVNDVVASAMHVRVSQALACGRFSRLVHALNGSRVMRAIN